jgi:NADPH:quinone reductase-like Zn-dependent oxidoreductase
MVVYVGDHTFELADAAKAHAVMTGRDFFGKLVLQVP